jgi:hypothetical protein
MGRWVRFFVGTPQRFLVTLAAIGGLYSVAHPGWLGGVVRQLGGELMFAVNPLIEPAFRLAILVAGFVWIVRAPFRKGGKK